MSTVSGTFIISLDFELHWGGFEKWYMSEYRSYFLNTRAVIPRMLERFAAHDVHVTWATVGMLLHRTWGELLADFPEEKPTYKRRGISAYGFIDTGGVDRCEESDPLHYADSLIRLIVDTPHQELASHTFAHYFCNEPGQTIAQFRADLRATQRAASRYGKQHTSLVFPRNTFDEQQLRVCFEEGFRSVRAHNFDRLGNIVSAAADISARLFTGSIGTGPSDCRGKSYALTSMAVKEGLPLCLPASRSLRPYRPWALFMNSWNISQICEEMDSAAAKGEVYHLWWSPHYFGWYPEQSMQGLERILQQYRKLQDAGKMKSLTMEEVTALRTQGREWSYTAAI